MKNSIIAPLLILGLGAMALAAAVAFENPKPTSKAVSTLYVTCIYKENTEVVLLDGKQSGVTTLVDKVSGKIQETVIPCVFEKPNLKK